MKNLSIKKAVILLLFCDFLALLYGISTLSIGADEAKKYFSEGTLLYYISHFGTFILGQNDFGLRIPFLFFHFLSCILLFILAKKYTKTLWDAFFALLLYVLLPGSVASALLVNEASLVILLSLAILCAYEYDKKFLFYILFVLAFFVSGSFSILFLTFFFYGIYKKRPFLFILALVLFVLSLSFYGFNTGGKPRGYFLDTLGIFAACFTPLVFIYFFYVIYRLAFKENKSLLWFLMSVTFISCSLFSLRQKLYLEDFLPFCVICTPLLINVLMASYRVRLPKFRLRYKIFIQCASIFLLCFYFLLVGNPLLYYVLKNPNDHFANNYHFAKELSFELKKQGVNELRVAPSLQERIAFYGIKDSNTFYLKSVKDENSLDKNEKYIIVKLGKHKRFFQVESYAKSL